MVGPVVQPDLISIVLRFRSYMIAKPADDEAFLRFSSFARLSRVVAYVLRFVNNARRGKESRLSSGLSCAEIQNAVLKIVFVLQHSEYASEVKELKGGSAVSRTSKLKDLNPFLYANELLRVGGRLMNADLSYDAKHPTILPPCHHVTRLLITHEHEKLLHSGPQLVLFSL
jgi:hypothetical protein